MKIKVYSQDGKQTGTAELPDEVFGGEVNAALLHQVIVGYAARSRQGTAKAKSRTEVSGGGRKPYRQKGTGHARAGSNTSPLWVRGGKAFGPVPRSYALALPRKMRKRALVDALSTRAVDGKVLAIEAMECRERKTKAVARMLEALPLEGNRTLLLTDGGEGSHDIYLAARNIRDLTVLPLSSVNAQVVLHNENIILSNKALVEQLTEAVKA